ncbi:MAG: DUF2922 domain-containing protein [Smithella sp.]
MADTNTKSLEMVFKSEGGKSVTVAVKDPKDGLTMAAVQTVMQTIITKNIFTSTSGNLVAVEEARIRQLAVTGLA